MSLYDAVKEAIASYVSNADLADVQYATVVSTSGSIKIIKNGITIPASFVDKPLEKSEVELEVEGQEKVKAVIHQKLKVGERVAVMKKSGGQRYTIIGRI